VNETLCLLIRDLVVAGFATRRAVVESVVTKPDVDLALAGTTVFFTKTLGFDRFALHASVFFGSSSGAHSTSLAPVAALAKVSEVTTISLMAAVFMPLPFFSSLWLKAFCRVCSRNDQPQPAWMLKSKIACP
jgi:hypothetical protein